MSNITFEEMFHNMEQAFQKIQPVNTVYNDLLIIEEVYGRDVLSKAILKYESDNLLQNVDVNIADIMGGK